MGWSGGNDLVLTAGKHADHMLKNGVDKKIVTSMLYDILDEVAQQDFDDFDSCVGHWDILDEVMAENEFVIGPATGEYKTRWWLGGGEWSLYEFLIDEGIIGVRDDSTNYRWLKYPGTEVGCDIVVNFDAKTVHLTHIKGVELPERVEI